jgi:predicted lipoprotein
VFGNAVRDSTGLVRSEEFANSQEFNTLAIALNGLVSTRVLSKLRDPISPGRRIEFVACVEVPGGAVKLPLFVTPLSATLL